MSGSIPAWAMERARKVVAAIKAEWADGSAQPLPYQVPIQNVLVREHIATTIATAHREGFEAGKEAAAQALERRAVGYASNHRDAIYNGGLIAEELNADARKCRSLPYPDPTETGK